MSPQEYIDSGILEAYALGAADPAEQREVEALCARHPEVQAALDAIREGLEVYATQHAVQPDPALRDKILRAASVHPEPKVIPLRTESSRWKGFAMAASIVLLFSIGANLYFINKMEDEKALYSQSSAAQTEALEKKQDELRRLQADLDNTQNTLAFVRNPMTKSVALNTTDAAKPMKAMVYWDTKTMMVVVDPMTLPQTKTDEQYVLWAMQDGKPVNYGAFTVSDSAGMMMLSSVEKAEGFAISLEKDANVTTPAGPVYVMGKP